MYSVRRITEGAWIESFCEWSTWPLCSSTRATPLKIITTARLSVHTLIGSKEVFRTKTLPFILAVILRERRRGCQNMFPQRRKDAKFYCCCPFLPLRLCAFAGNRSNFLL